MFKKAAILTFVFTYLSLSSFAENACEEQGGFPMKAYGRTVCNFKTLDQGKPCGADHDCQGNCLLVSTVNASQKIDQTPTENPRNPGRCSMYSHPVGCATLFTGEKWCSTDDAATTLKKGDYLKQTKNMQLRVMLERFLNNLDQGYFSLAQKTAGLTGCTDENSKLLCTRSKALECLMKGNTTILLSQRGYICSKLTSDGGKKCSTSEKCQGICTITQNLSTEELVEFWENGDDIGECSLTHDTFGCVRKLIKKDGVPSIQRICRDE
ncbi:MAG: hypothetical protein OSB62_06435 [Alphaproteobacteria bacterium]|nr:hypothetical protein [Alphaproteobacteria bacterium]